MLLQARYPSLGDETLKVALNAALTRIGEGAAAKAANGKTP